MRAKSLKTIIKFVPDNLRTAKVWNIILLWYRCRNFITCKTWTRNTAQLTHTENKVIVKRALSKGQCQEMFFTPGLFSVQSTITCSCEHLVRFRRNIRIRKKLIRGAHETAWLLHFSANYIYLSPQSWTCVWKNIFYLQS